MIVVYAQGGGLGHLTRAHAALHTLGAHGPVTYLTSSPFATDPRVIGDASVRQVPMHLARDPGALRAFVRDQLRSLEPSELVVDAFPFGIAGELDASVVPERTRVTHLARLLRWDAYTALAPPPGAPLDFDTTYLVEPIAAEHESVLALLSTMMTPLTLIDPPLQAAPPTVPVGAWLVVHAGAIDETRQLVAFARDQAAAETVHPALVVIATADRGATLPGTIDGAPVVETYPAWPLFAAAGRIITAAGFNAVRQLAPHRDRHRILPFPRRFDDQFERARRARRPDDPTSRG